MKSNVKSLMHILQAWSFQHDEQDHVVRHWHLCHSHVETTDIKRCWLRTTWHVSSGKTCLDGDFKVLGITKETNSMKCTLMSIRQILQVVHFFHRHQLSNPAQLKPSWASWELGRMPSTSHQPTWLADLYHIACISNHWNTHVTWRLHNLNWAHGHTKRSLALQQARGARFLFSCFGKHCIPLSKQTQVHHLQPAKHGAPRHQWFQIHLRMILSRYHLDKDNPYVQPAIQGSRHQMFWRNHHQHLPQNIETHSHAGKVQAEVWSLVSHRQYAHHSLHDQHQERHCTTVAGVVHQSFLIVSYQDGTVLSWSQRTCFPAP